METNTFTGLPTKKIYRNTDCVCAEYSDCCVYIYLYICRRAQRSPTLSLRVLIQQNFNSNRRVWGDILAGGRSIRKIEANPSWSPLLYIYTHFDEEGKSLCGNDFNYKGGEHWKIEYPRIFLSPQFWKHDPFWIFIRVVVVQHLVSPYKYPMMANCVVCETASYQAGWNPLPLNPHCRGGTRRELAIFSLL